VKEHVRRLRLERAAGQLKAGAAPITDIALAAGYGSHEAFTRSFRSAFGASPSQFRASCRARPAPVAPFALRSGGGKLVGPFPAEQQRAPKMDVRIEHARPIRVAFMRHVGPYSQVGATWDRLLLALGREGWLGGSPLLLGICHDDPEVTPPAKIRYDACVSVNESFVPEDEIGVQVIPGGDYAVTTHFGPYRRLGETYARLLGQWLPRSGRELRAAPCFEVYLNDPQSTSPEDLVTDIHAPLAEGVRKPKAGVKPKSKHEKSAED
jgi:AraC family transcriptional regulator